MTGFFQRFRPDGHKLEQLFGAIPAGLEVLDRLRRVYAATNNPSKDSGRSDMYFIVRKPLRTSDGHLLRCAAEQVTNWRNMAVDFSSQELVDLLTPIPQVRLSKGQPPRVEPTDYDSLDVLIYDVQSDWHGSLIPNCQHANWMREAFYYINCDYHLAHYLTWPWYMKSSRIVEPFEPYFHLWLHGAQLRCQSQDEVTLFVPSPSA